MDVVIKIEPLKFSLRINLWLTIITQIINDKSLKRLWVKLISIYCRLMVLRNYLFRPLKIYHSNFENSQTHNVTVPIETKQSKRTNMKRKTLWKSVENKNKRRLAELFGTTNGSFC
jgi:hypothetical protein